MFTKPKTFGVFLFVLILLLGLTITASADGEFPPSPEPTVVRSVENPVTISAPLSIADLLTSDPTTDLLLTPKVIGGTPVSPENKYPWMVSQQWYGGNFCGGTLIDKEWVLTAAHCWVSEIAQPPYYAVIMPTAEQMVLGEYDITSVSSHEQSIAVSEVYIHPDFDPEYLKYDVALLKLATPATLNDYVQTINLTNSTYNNNVLSNFNGIIAGWGMNDYVAGTYPDVMYEASVDFLSDSACSYYGASYDPVSMLCAGKIDGSRDTCYGDSGGPVAFEQNGFWRQAGITSWGNECGLANYPGVYARVSAVYDWIQSFINTNLLSNPSTEYFKPNGWEWLFTSNLEPGEGANCDQSLSGSCSFGWDGNGSTKTVAMRYTYNGSPGDTIQFSLYRKGLNIPATGSVFVKIVALDLDGSTEKVTKLISGGNASVWTNYVLSLTTVEAYKRIDITIVNSMTSGTLWMDDLSLKINGGSEMLTTPDIESFVPDDWQFGINLETGEGADCSVAHTGFCSFGWDGNGTVKSLALRYPNAGKINGLAGDTVIFSLFRKGANIPATGSVFVKLVLIHADGSTQKVVQKISGGDVSNWVEYTIETIALEDYKRVDITVVNSMPSGTMWIDDFGLGIQ